MISNIDLRETNLGAPERGALDVLILGGGINGAGIARDLALRCLRGGVTLRIGLVEPASVCLGNQRQELAIDSRRIALPEGAEFGLVHERCTSGYSPRNGAPSGASAAVSDPDV